MTKTQSRLGVVAIFAAILLFNLTSPNRCKVVSGDDLSGYVIDGVTGETKALVRFDSYEVE
jgi:hypothetical protein